MIFLAVSIDYAALTVERSRRGSPAAGDDARCRHAACFRDSRHSQLAASEESSRKGVPGSSSSMRSRGRIFAPRQTPEVAERAGVAGPILLSRKPARARPGVVAAEIEARVSIIETSFPR